MKPLAQRYGEGIETSDLEAIYEWTYKYQMLEREENLGDYGAPAILPDSAYMESAKLKAQLAEKLNEVYERMVEVYDDWISDHAPLIDYYYEDAREYWNSKRSEVDHGMGHMGDIGELVGEEDVKTTIIEYFDDEEIEEEEEEEDEYAERIKYLDSFASKTAQEYQKQFPFIEGPEWLEQPEEEVTVPSEEMTFDEVVDLPIVKEHQSAILDVIEEENYFDTFIENEAESLMEMAQEDSPLGDVMSMREALNEWDNLTFGDRIILFQEALTTMHNNGEMAEYLLADDNAVEILNQLSEGEEVPEWDYELSRLLGYPLGSRISAPVQEWFIPAFSCIAALSLDELENIYELTYKHQMLTQEEQLGDYGVPQTLPDSAYIEKARMEQELTFALDSAQPEMIETYQTWLDSHYEWANQQALEGARESEYEHLSNLDEEELGNIFGEQRILDIIVEENTEYIRTQLRYVIEEEEEVSFSKSPVEEEEDEYAERIKYLDSFASKQAQEYQKQMPFVEGPEWLEYDEKTIDEEITDRMKDLDLDDDIIIDAFNENVDRIVDELMEGVDDNYLQERADEMTDEYLYESAYPGVEDMKLKLEDDWLFADFSEKIILFQEALTTAHNNGDMAEYLLNDRNAVAILKELSAGPNVPEWNQDLSSLLGYELGSRAAPSQEFFVPAALKHLAQVIALLDRVRITPQPN